MKKAGIITLFGEFNFGNRLQNYAVQKILEKRGLDVETIKYMSKNVHLPIIENRRDEERLKLFQQFNKNIKFADKTLYVEEQIPVSYGEEYDYIVLGSDQIWNYTFSKTFSEKALASFVPRNKKFSFSASFGVDCPPEKDSKNYTICKTYLSDLKAISVREDAGKEIIKQLTGREDVEVIIDPTMMLDLEEWEKVMKKPENLKTDKFILKSFLGNSSEEVLREIERVAKENECQIIDISDRNSEFYNVGPAEFLYLEKNAFMVATDSFHSCVFAILFSTPFVVFERQDNMASMNSRIETLLKKFEIEECICHHQIANEIFTRNDTRIQEILKRERKKANQFLDKALM